VIAAAPRLPIPAELVPALADYLLALGDDEVLLGHRDAEWTGLGPILEEDIAFSSMAQDEMGHALVWYELRAAIAEEDADALVYRRAAPGWRNAVLFELPRGDYAFSLVRRFLADAAEVARCERLVQSALPALAAAAERIRREERYHILHGQTFLERLAFATKESRARLQSALDVAWPYALGIWEPTAGEGSLVAAGFVPAAAEVRDRWLGFVTGFLEPCGMSVPAAAVPVVGGRAGRHSADLDEILDALQRLRRLDPEATW
jgi:ring-1,2-phenylacetyl-CoA epoxidase subunit PaaC